MHKIDGDLNNNGLFQSGDPVQGTEGTLVTADWLNDVQQNLLKVLEEAGIAPTKGRESDVLDAINRLIAAGSGNDLADVAALAALSGSTAAVVKVLSGGGDGRGDYWFLDPYDETSASDGTTVVVDADGNRWKKQLSASFIPYSDGSTIESLRPAEFGANVTGNHTAANTVAVGGTAAAIVEAGALAGKDLSDALEGYGLDQTIAQFVETSNLAAENTSLAAVNVNDWNSTWTPSRRSHVFNFSVDKANKRVSLRHKGFDGHSGTAFVTVEIEVVGNTFVSLTNVSAEASVQSKGSDVSFSGDADLNKWGPNGLLWSESVGGESDDRIDLYLDQAVTGGTLFRVRFRRIESDDTQAYSYFAGGDTPVLARIAVPVQMVLSPLDNSDKDVLLMTNAPADAGATNRKTFYRSTAPAQPGDDLHAGDLWIDTDNSNKLSRWDGTTWVDVRDAGAAAGEGLVTGGPVVLDPSSLEGVNIGGATIDLNNVTGGVSLESYVNGLSLQNNAGFERGQDGLVAIPVGWFREGLYTESRTQYYQDAPSDSDYGSSLSYGASSETQNGGSVGWWAIGKKFSTGATGLTMSLSARVKLASVGSIPDPITYTAGAETWLADDDAYFQVRFYEADGTQITTSDAVQYSEGAAQQSGLSGSGHSGEWFTLEHSFSVPSDTFRIDVFLVAVSGGDQVRDLGYKGTGDAAAQFDDFTWSYPGVMNEVTEATWAKEPGATHGATWGQDISGQPNDEDLLNAQQQWSDVSGPGRPEDGATNSKTFLSSTPPANPGSDIHLGDLWVDTDDANHLYRWDGSSWVSVRDRGITDALNAAASALASTVAGAITTYFQSSEPLGYADGDLWFDTDDGNKLYRFSLTSPQLVTGDNSDFEESIGDWSDLSSGGAGNEVSWSFSGEEMVLSASGGSAVASLEVTGLTVGVTYDFRYNLKSVDGTFGVSVGTTAGGSETLSDSESTTGFFRVLFEATSTTHYLVFSYSGSSSASVDTVYLREAGEWEPAQDETIGELVTNLATVEAVADSKIKTYLRDTAPSNPADDIDEGDLWWDSDESRLYRWDSGSSQWVIASIQGTSEIVDDAALGENAVWGNIIGSGKPEDGATNSKTFVSATPPANPASDLHIGDIWFDTDDGNKQYRWDGSSWVAVQDSGADAGNQLAQALVDAGLGQNIADLVNDANVARSSYSLAGVNVNDWSVIYPGGGYRGGFVSLAIDRDPDSPNFKRVTLGLYGRNGHLGTTTVSLEIEVNNNTIASATQNTWSSALTEEVGGVDFVNDTDSWGPNGIVTFQTITDAVDHVMYFTLASAPDPTTVFRFKLKQFTDSDVDGHAFVTFGDKLVASDPRVPFQTLFNAADGSDYDVLLMTNGPAQAGATNSKTFAQGTDPSVDPSADLHVGDLWLDVSNGNKLYRWDGNTWLDVQDDGAVAGGELRQALIDAGLGQSIADLVSVTNKSSESWPLGSVNVNDWSGEYSPSKRGPHFNISVNPSAKTITVKHAGVNGHDGASTINVEIEVSGVLVDSYTQGTSGVTLVEEASGVEFGVDTNSWGPNGLSWTESLTDAASHTQVITLEDTPDETTVIRLRVREFSTDDALATTIFSLGDTAIASNLSAPKEVYFSVIDGTNFDVLIMQNAPAAAGANVTAPPISAKKNYSDFNVINTGEIYLHGFNDAGSPADVDGYITYNGQKLSVPKQSVMTSVTAAGYLYLDTSFSDRFEMEDGSFKSVVFAVKNRGEWSYDDNSTLVSFTPANGDLVIGTVIAQSDSVLEATAWGYGMAPGVVSDAGATNSKTFAQSAEPSGDVNAGDFWVDTDDGNKLYRYDGSSWVSLRDSGAAAGIALSQALDDAGLGQDITDFVVSSNRASLYSGPSSLNNVVDWSVYSVPNQTSHLLHLAINKSTRVVTITYAGISSPSGTATLRMELEVLGNTVSSFDSGSFDSSYTESFPSPVTFDGSGTEVGSNGIKVEESTQDTQDQATITLANAIAGSTVFRLKIYEWDYTEKGYVIFGDTPAMVNPTAPVEFFFSPLDGQDYDVLVMKNAPSEAGATNSKTFYQDEPPANPGDDLHAGDIWFDTNDGNKQYRWDGSSWISTRDEGIQQAIDDAASAQATADGKITTFYQDDEPSVGVDEGDIWFDTNDGNKIYVYTSGSWVNSQDSAIAQAINDAATAQSIADGKITTYFTSDGNPPAGTMVVGDLWYDELIATLKRWNGSSWVNVSDVTSEHTSNDTENVNQVPSDVVGSSSGTVFRNGFESNETSVWGTVGTGSLSYSAGAGTFYAGSRAGLISGESPSDKVTNLMKYGANLRDHDAVFTRASVMRDVGGPFGGDCDLLVSTSDSVFTKWEFTNGLNFLTGDNCTLTIADEVMRITPTAYDPQVERNGIGFDGSLFNQIVARVRRVSGSGWQGRVYYTTSGHGHSSSYFKQVDADVGSDWVILTWDMTSLTAGGSDWVSNTITGVRFDFGQYIDDVIEVDYIKILPLDGVSNSHGVFTNITSMNGNPLTSGSKYTFSTVVKAKEIYQVFVRMYASNNSTAGRIDVRYDLNDGSFLMSENSNFSDIKYDIYTLFDGWYLISMSGALGFDADVIEGRIYSLNGNGGAGSVSSLDSLRIAGSSLFYGDHLGRYVETTGDAIRNDYGWDLEADSYVKCTLPSITSYSLAGQRAKISMFVKKPSSGAASRVYVRYSPGTSGAGEWRDFTIGDSWRRIEHIVDVPVGDVGRMDEVHIATMGGGDVLVDSITIEAITKSDDIDAESLLNKSFLVSSVELSVNEITGTASIFDGTDKDTWKDLISTTVNTTGNDLVVIKGLADMTALKVVNDNSFTPYINQCISTSGWTLGSGWSLRNTGSTNTRGIYHSSGTATASVNLTGLSVGEMYVVAIKIATPVSYGGNYQATISSGGSVVPGGVSVSMTASVSPTSSLYDGFTSRVGFVATSTSATLQFTPTTDFNCAIDNIIVSRSGPGIYPDPIGQLAVGSGGPRVNWRVMRNGNAIYTSDDVIISGAGSQPTLFFDIADTAADNGSSEYKIQLRWKQGTYSAGSIVGQDLNTGTAGPSYIYGSGTYWSGFLGPGWIILDNTLTAIAEVLLVINNETLLVKPLVDRESTSTIAYGAVNLYHSVVMQRGRSFFHVTEFRN